MLKAYGIVNVIYVLNIPFNLQIQLTGIRLSWLADILYAWQLVLSQLKTKASTTSQQMWTYLAHVYSCINMVQNTVTMLTKAESLSFQTVTNTTWLWCIGQSSAVYKRNHGLLLMRDFSPKLTVV